MKKNVWKELKKENNAKALNLEIEDQRYLDKVTAYAVNQGVGMMETEIIRKDLIGIAAVSYTHLDVYKRQILISCSNLYSMETKCAADIQNVMRLL